MNSSNWSSFQGDSLESRRQSQQAHALNPSTATFIPASTSNQAAPLSARPYIRMQTQPTRSTRTQQLNQGPQFIATPDVVHTQQYLNSLNPDRRRHTSRQTAESVQTFQALQAIQYDHAPQAINPNPPPMPGSPNRPVYGTDMFYQPTGKALTMKPPSKEDMLNTIGELSTHLGGVYFQVYRDPEGDFLAWQHWFTEEMTWSCVYSPAQAVQNFPQDVDGQDSAQQHEPTTHGELMQYPQNEAAQPSSEQEAPIIYGELPQYVQNEAVQYPSQEGTPPANGEPIQQHEPDGGDGYAKTS